MKVRIKIDDRLFIVVFDDSGRPDRIKEEKIYGRGEFYEHIYHSTYWSSKHHKLGSAKTLPSRIIELASKKLC